MSETAATTQGTLRSWFVVTPERALLDETARFCGACPCSMASWACCRGRTPLIGRLGCGEPAHSSRGRGGVLLR